MTGSGLSSFDTDGSPAVTDRGSPLRLRRLAVVVILLVAATLGTAGAAVADRTTNQRFTIVPPLRPHTGSSPQG